MTSLLNLHTFMVVNYALAAGYLAARGVIKLPWLAQRLTQAQKLSFARCCFVFTILAFVMMPEISTIMPLHHANIEIQPILMHASSSFLQHHETVAAQVASVSSVPIMLPMSTIITCAWLTGSVLFLARYLRTLFNLKKLRDRAYYLRNSKQVSILLSREIDTPFCWSFLQRYYIALPEVFLTTPDNMRLAIRHESQHIRQGDTYWLHAINIVKSFCYWNPFLNLWASWLNDLQEFSCDETIILQGKARPADYAQCLLDTASTHAFATGVLSINGKSTFTLYRRIDMLFSYKRHKRKLISTIAYAAGIICITTAAYAVNNSSATSLTASDVRALIKYSHLKNTFQVTATPEVVNYLNVIRTNPDKKQKMLASLERMKTYQPEITQQLHHAGMPDDLLALPLTESGYRPLDESSNRVKAAGIWQIIPSTSYNLGLVLTANRDDRLDTKLSTKAALSYLQALHEQFHDWKLAVMAYELGENEVERLIAETGSRDARTIARSSSVRKSYREELSNYLAMFDASVILIHNPSILN